MEYWFLVAGEEKPRIFQGGRDMMLSLAVTVAAMLLVVGATGLCSINPEESNYARQNPVDASTFLTMESRSTGAALRDPHMPEGWAANSARRTQLGDQPAAVVGWVTAQDGFVQSTQTALSLEDAFKAFDGQYRGQQRTVDVDGISVQVRESDDPKVKPVWGFDLGDARVLLSGSAAEEDFMTAVSEFAATLPLPVQ